MNFDNWSKTVEWVGIVAGCLIEKEGKFLFVQEKQEKVYGLWNLPVGHVDKGETIEEAAIREVEEETGYKVSLGKKVGLFHESTNRKVKHIFKGEIIGGKLKPQKDEILAVKWLTYDEIKDLKDKSKLRSPWIWELFQKIYTN